MRKRLDDLGSSHESVSTVAMARHVHGNGVVQDDHPVTTWLSCGDPSV